MPGEIADMMLDGTLCAACGVPLFEPADPADGIVPWGFPNYCSPQCARDQGATHWKGGMLCDPEPRQYGCDRCNRKFRTRGARRQHKRDAHKETPDA